jgi:hypothetical protein
LEGIGGTQAKRHHGACCAEPTWSSESRGSGAGDGVAEGQAGPILRELREELERTTGLAVSPTQMWRVVRESLRSDGAQPVEEDVAPRAVLRSVALGGVELLFSAAVLTPRRPRS